jgi:hypothetical protein
VNGFLTLLGPDKGATADRQTGDQAGANNEVSSASTHV